MGGIPCDIVINCGFAKGAAAALIAFGTASDSPLHRHLTIAGAQLRDQEDEVCRFGETAAIEGLQFTETQEQAIYDGGANAEKLTALIESTVLKASPSDDELGSLLTSVRMFIAAQQAFFRELLAELYATKKTK